MSLYVTVRVNAEVIEDIVITNQGARSASEQLLAARPDARIYHWGVKGASGMVTHYRDEGYIPLLTKVLADIARARANA